MNIDLINYRRKRAKEALADAKSIFEHASLFSTVNRIYYAIFYQVVALLLTKDLTSKKHTGIRSLFNKEFVKTEIIQEELAEFYNRMFEFRQKDDYGDFVEFEKQKVKEWLNKTENFINRIEEVIENLTQEKK
ncbi:HEPN domain-containing protein [Candidatus Aerophobetes bacterium]|nr:HEPN domain-containing protein [Candidatus Aerophobetes bacterium]